MDPFAAALDAAANAARGTKRPRQNGVSAGQAQQEYLWSISGESPKDAWVRANRPRNAYSDALTSGAMPKEEAWIGANQSRIAGCDGHQPGQRSGYGQSLAGRQYGERGSCVQPHIPSQQHAGMQPYSATGSPQQCAGGSHDQSHNLSQHHAGMQKSYHTYGTPGTRPMCGAWGGQVGLASAQATYIGQLPGYSHTPEHTPEPPTQQTYPAGHTGHLAHPAYQTYPAHSVCPDEPGLLQGQQRHHGNQVPHVHQVHGYQGHQRPVAQSGQRVQSVHSYGARMAYGSGPSQDARRHPTLCGSIEAPRADRGRDIVHEPLAPRKHEVPQAHKIFIGGLPQNATEGELLKYFEKVGGPVADVLILKDFTTGRHRGFAFVMFKEELSVDKVVATQADKTKLHEIRPGKYIEAKRAAEKDNAERGAEDAIQRASTKPTLKNLCMDCGKNNPKFCMPNENKKRWCSECAQRNHPEAVKSRTTKEKKQREDRCEVFQWARAREPVRCAYWIVAECPNMKAGKVCDRIHECKNCGFTDTNDNQQKGCPNCPDGWWRKRSTSGGGS